MNVNIGEMVEAQLKEKQVVLPAGRRLIGFKVFGVPSGKLTVPATVRQRGFIMCGTGDTFSPDKVWADHWVLHPVEHRFGSLATFFGQVDEPTVLVTAQGKFSIPAQPQDLWGKHVELACEASAIKVVEGGLAIEKIARISVTKDETGGSGVQAAPAMVLAHKIQVECVTCGKQAIWRDLLLDGSEIVRDGDRINRILKCPKCSAVLKVLGRVPVRMVTHNSRMEGLYNDGYEQNPEYKAFVEAHSTGQKLQLPSIWAVYRKDRTPGEWMPGEDDTRGQQLAARVEQDGFTIRPFAMGCKVTNYRGSLVQFLMDVPRTVDCGFGAGWVDEAELYENKLEGFKRRLMYPPKQYTAARPTEPTYSV